MKDTRRLSENEGRSENVLEWGHFRAFAAGLFILVQAPRYNLIKDFSYFNVAVGLTLSFGNIL